MMFNLRPVNWAWIAYWWFTLKIAPEVLWICFQIIRSNNKDEISVLSNRAHGLFWKRKEEFQRVYTYHAHRLRRKP